jgi:uncharacterized protein YndB with AHSA1/START domain
MPTKRTPASDASDDRRLVIKRSYDAPIDLVWKVWADQQQARQWWGPRGFKAPIVELDERPGGKWRALMIGPDGIELWQHGVYREIVPKKRIVYTFVWDREPDHQMLVSVDFAAKGKKTEITFEQTGFTSDGEREGHRRGWGESFDRLGEYLKQVGSAARKTSKPAKGDAHARR